MSSAASAEEELPPSFSKPFLSAVALAKADQVRLFFFRFAPKEKSDTKKLEKFYATVFRKTRINASFSEESAGVCCLNRQRYAQRNEPCAPSNTRGEERELLSAQGAGSTRWQLVGCRPAASRASSAPRQRARRVIPKPTFGRERQPRQGKRNFALPSGTEQ